MLMPIVKELFLWLYGLFLDMIGFCANSLLSVMATDLTYFEKNVPAVKTMYGIFVAVGWALLIGNMVFQAMKAMFSGVGFEGEDPAVLMVRTGIFGFLLVFSRQICDIGMGISKKTIELLGIPKNIQLKLPEENFFGGFDSSWMLVIIIGLILGIQLVKLFFEIGERYVIVAVLTLLAPLGFSMGGSKSTKDIFTGYIRMYASMLLMMVMNVVFLKLILSAMSVMPNGVMIVPWGILVVGLAKAARKIDSLVSKIGLNPAITGEPLSRGGLGAATMMAARMAISSVSKAGHSFHSNSQGSGAPTGARSTPRRPYSGMSGQSHSYQSQAGTNRQQSSVSANMQNNQHAGHMQGGAVNAPQNVSFRSNANVGGSNGVNYNRFGMNTASSNVQNVSQAGIGKTVPHQNVKLASPANVTAGGTRFGQAPKQQIPMKNNPLKTNQNGVAGKPAPFGSMKTTPNLRKPMMPIIRLPEQIPQQTDNNAENSQPTETKSNE